MGSIDIIKPMSTLLSRGVNKSQQNQIISSEILRKNFGNAENWTRGCWVRSKHATSVLCSPPTTTLSNAKNFTNPAIRTISTLRLNQTIYLSTHLPFDQLNIRPIGGSPFRDTTATNESVTLLTKSNSFLLLLMRTPGGFENLPDKFEKDFERKNCSEWVLRVLL